MESIRQVFRIGNGPSSSHTMGPSRAAKMFLEKCPQASKYRVTLYGSLAATGKGHLTDVAILNVLEAEAPTEIVWRPKTFLDYHPNGMYFEGLNDKDEKIEDWTIFSIGGGILANDHFNELRSEEVYPLSTISEIMNDLDHRGMNYWEYVEEIEGPGIWDYLAEIWEVMKQAVKDGLEAEGVLPGGLGLKRKAANYHVRSQGYQPTMKSRGSLFAYALAVAEQNASGGIVVTAPTCGSCGVVPGVLYHLQEQRGFTDVRILRALATA
ncbi:MAG: serine dehydratase beta chain, partial [Porphyromonadaceae bacterium]|nr:serine dehydratase beta chain [Porphyromonadaceae bacterium]